MNSTVYEHPLNEKVRLLLRLEALFNQLDTYRDVSESANIQPFFAALFQTIEVLERNDVRTSLGFYLELIEKSMVRWSQRSDVEMNSLQKELAQAVRLQQEVSQTAKACKVLKADRFLSSLKQRFAIAGGTCDFDLPQLHYWRLKPHLHQLADIHQWLTCLDVYIRAMSFSMMFLRGSAGFRELIATKGFYQDSPSQKISFLRIKYDPSLGYFPMVSGNKNRYSITFMEPDKHSVKTSTNDNIPFQLSVF